MDSNIFQEIAESYLQSQVSVLRNLSAKIEFPFISEFAGKTEVFLREKFAAIRTKKDLLEFQNVIDALDEINSIFLRTTDESSYWVISLVKQFYQVLGIDTKDRDILIVNDGKVSYEEGGYGVIVDLFNDRSLSEINFPATKKLDVFFLPAQSNFSISSVAILAHEVGHVYFSCNPGIRDEIVKQVIGQLKADHKDEALFKNTLQKIAKSNLTAQAEEHFCDGIGYYLLGPVFSFALIKILGLNEEEDLTYQQGNHPPIYKRLYNAKADFLAFLNKASKSGKLHSAGQKIKERFFDNLDLIPPSVTSLGKDEVYFVDLANQAAKASLIKHLGKESVYEVKEYEAALAKCLPNLNILIPLVETIEIEKTEIITPWELLVATIFYFSGNLFESDNRFFLDSGLTKEEKIANLKKILINFLKYSINIYSFYSKIKVPLPDSAKKQNTVWKLRERGGSKVDDSFIVVPTIDFEKQYASNAVDLRLGNSFITSKLTEFTHIPTNPSTNSYSNKNIEYFFEKHFIPFHKTFTLHPHSFVLAVTLEYICIPVDHYALVLGRSTWGRLGLNIATATAVGPGFKGCITLELRNLSEVPINLNVGTRICQICLIKNPVELGATSYYLNTANKYICPTEVEYPKINLDPDWSLLNQFYNADPH